MKISELKLLMQRARQRKAVNPCLTAVVIAFSPGLKDYTAKEICGLLDIPESYESTVRSNLRVAKELNMLGYNITND